MIDVVVTQRVNVGMEEAFEAILRELAANTRAQDKGCLRYEWYRADAAQTYVLLERWADEQSIQDHLKANHVVALLPRMRDCIPEKYSALRLASIE
jgi:quinol monooxygenase YgiN